MEADSPRWKEITRSEFPWEREALAFVREGLPDREPYRAWSNFEFIADDGSINEVDLLVLTPKGFFLVEIKSHPGTVRGDAGTWTWHHEGRDRAYDNPLLLANRKAKKLKSLLMRQQAMQKVRSPFLEAHVFLSHEEVDCRLPQHLRNNVHARDRIREDDGHETPGITAALTRWTSETAPRYRLDRPLAKAVTRAMEEAGIRPSQRARRLGDYELEELVLEGPTYQDWTAHHVALKRDRARVRIYPIELGASQESRQTVTNAAKREYQILSGISHEGILKPKHYTDSDRGPALIFEHQAESRRFDHYLSEQGEKLAVDQRLELLRQVADAIRYAHEKHLVHRALSPQNILVLDPEKPLPTLQIFNWQTGIRTPSDSRMTTLGISATSHVNDLVEDASTVYMAPEALAERAGPGEQQDVFSLGALAYHLFSGQPPAGSFYELTEKLRDEKGLQITSVLNGVPESLQYLIQFSTFPAVSDRLDSVSEFLDFLDKVEEELTAPDVDEDLIQDPTAAKGGDRLDHGFTVRKRLGKGSAAIALLVERNGKEQVLKVALDPSHNDRLEDEAEVLKALRRHQYIVQTHELLRFGDRLGLLMDKAGNETLGQRLRQEGRLHLELLERFGEDLLQTVDWLEQEGVPHRDIKPENLGVAPMGRGDSLHLVLFDFSLSRTPPENVRAGTVPYLDPFLSLRKPPRWDTYAERFAAAMTLYEMATGQLPRWGDGQSDPLVLDVEATLDADAFEPALRDKMLGFFEKALRRDYRQRFDNAQEMLSAWRDAFVGASGPAVDTDHGEEATDRVRIPADVTLGTTLVLLGLSTRALNALDRVGASTVEDFLRTPIPQISHMRGVGSKTRREIAQFAKELAKRFPDIERRPLEDEEAAAAEAAALSVDALALQLLPTRIPKKAQPSQNAIRSLLRLGEGGGSVEANWPSQSDVAREVGVTRARIGQVLAQARKRWLKIPALTALRNELVTILDSQGGVMTAAELAEAILSRRGSAQQEPLRTRQGMAVVRAAIEAERDRANPRWIVRRPHDGGRILVARDELDENGEPRIDGQGLADYAERLGRRADELAQADPLLPPDRALEALQAVPAPAGVAPLPPARLRPLATAAGREAALSSRLELYPRAMSPARALKLAVGALIGSQELTVEQIQERVRGRYPEAAPLPERPELDRILGEAGSNHLWKSDAADGRGAFVAPKPREFTTVHSGTSYTTRTRTLTPRFQEVPADQAERKQFQQRLQYSLDQQHFLVLVVSPPRAQAAEQALARRFPLDVRSFDELLIRHMKQFAVERKVDWGLVLRADGVPPAERSGNRDWNNLQRVVREALPRVQAELAESPRHVLLTNLGLLARYDQLAFLDCVRDETGRAAGPPGLWLLVATDAQGERPTLDGKPVPVFTSAQWARIPSSWLSEGSNPQASEEASSR